MESTAVVSPPTSTTTGERPRARTTGDAAALAFSRRMQLIDRIARALISFSGLSIICAVLGIGVFLFAEVMPLLLGARVTPLGARPITASGASVVLLLADEHQERAALIGETPEIRIVPLRALAEGEERVALPELAGERVSAASKSAGRPEVALATDQGLVWIGAVGWQTTFEGNLRRIQAEVEPWLIVPAAPGHQVTQVAARHHERRTLIAAVVNGASVVLTRVTTRKSLLGPARRMLESVAVPLGESGRPTALLIDEPGAQFLVGTDRGRLLRWRVAQGETLSAEQVEDLEVIPGGSVTAMTYLLGGRSVAIGGSDGSVATWSLVRREDLSDGWSLTSIHSFSAHRAAVARLVASPRDKGFITVSSDGEARLRYMTSERTLARMAVGTSPQAAEFAPKANGLLAIDRDGMLHHWAIQNPHPEVSWQTLFGRVWYEGYEHPDYIWQSTGGTDDFEPKFSLVPLVIGTLKGTCYALLFAVPLALFGALYCSQFLEKRLRSPVKSAVELMAALPSVVLGFIAGVVIAPMVQGNLAAVLSVPVCVPLTVALGMLLLRRVQAPAFQVVMGRHEFWLLTALALLGLAIAGLIGPWMERACFGGNVQAWLSQATGARYDQRNSLVVGWAMGFAVIPIIFTVCEDAFSAVPKHLVAASLACGASAWQTAWRVVLPAAGSGVFSAVMIGFGRAVGETMIVLMATGNTPVMNWSIFNGFRALSANIAVEIPEAPHGGTLYRILFVAALLLFSITFVVNTVAEVVRLRLRRRLQGI